MPKPFVTQSPFMLSGFAMLLALAPGVALGHYSWLEPQGLQAAPGESVPVIFGWGHHPGEDDSLSASRMASLSIWQPSGQWRGLPLHGAQSIESGVLEAPGHYVLAARQSRGYWSRTAEGGKRGSLQQYPNATSCSYSDNSSKALLKVGQADDGAEVVSRPLGQSLEIVPERLPEGIEEGAPVPVQVMLHGEPLAGATLTVYREDHEEEAQAATWSTDEQGRARLDLASGHSWLAHVETTLPFHDQSLCHEHSLNATLRFRR